MLTDTTFWIDLAEETYRHEQGPARHFIATANNNIMPPGYKHELGYEWAVPFRVNRITEVLKDAVLAGNVSAATSLKSLPTAPRPPISTKRLFATS